METKLIIRRERAMDLADKALEKAWPDRTGEEYVQAMKQSLSDLQLLAAEMKRENCSFVEQCRTYRYIGSIYFDLAPALGRDLLLSSMKSYQKAESFLKSQYDKLEMAKLNFNLGNTLCQMDPDDVDLLYEARKRTLAAKEFFSIHESLMLPRIEEALQSVENQIKKASISKEIKDTQKEMAHLGSELNSGGNEYDILNKMKALLNRKGGVAGMIARVKAFLDYLPDNPIHPEKKNEISRQLEGLISQLLNGNEQDSADEGFWSLLKERLDNSVATTERKKSLFRVIEDFQKIQLSDEGDLLESIIKLNKIREFINNKFEYAHYPSYGIKRPKEGTHAAKMVELNWSLRKYILEEMNQPENGEQESKRLLDLQILASKVDRSIYEAGKDMARLKSVEREKFRPMAINIRKFSSRMYTTFAQPIWSIKKIHVDANSVFYSGSEKGSETVENVCNILGLEMMLEPTGRRYDTARWTQIQKSIVAVFDLRLSTSIRIVAVTYELGIAMTIGKPLVILVDRGQKLPFDIDINPTVLPVEADEILKAAIEQAIVWRMPRTERDVISMTYDHVLWKYQRPHKNIYVDQTLRVLHELPKPLDPISVSQVLSKLFDFLPDSSSMLISSYWPPKYEVRSGKRLFHVTSYRPQWAENVTSFVRDKCSVLNVEYIRGDEVNDPHVISSIWNEIGQASHVLVDLTGSSPNVTLELGISHVLGKKVLIVGQEEAESMLFQSISKYRTFRYDLLNMEAVLGHELREFLE